MSLMMSLKSSRVAHGFEREQGTALLSVILLLATVTLLVTEMTERQFLDIRRTGNLISLDQAYLYAQAAESLAISALNEDFKTARDEGRAQIDHLNETWRNRVDFPLEGGTITAQLTDLQGRFNLNELLGNRWQARDRFLKLVNGLDIDGDVDAEALLFAIVEWMDGDDQSQTGGAEELYYLGLEKPYRTGNQLLRSVSELRLIKGFTPEIVDRLKPYVVALPEITHTNINTVDIEVLTTFPGVTQVQSIIDGRGEEGYETVEAAFNGLTKKPSDLSAFSVYSQYFLLESKVEIGGRVARLRTVIYRPFSLSIDNPIEIISRNRAREFTLPAKS